MSGRDAAVAAAGARLAQAWADLDERPPREAAAAAYVPGGPSLADLENRIRALRGLPATSDAA